MNLFFDCEAKTRIPANDVGDPILGPLSPEEQMEYLKILCTNEET